MNLENCKVKSLEYRLWTVKDFLYGMPSLNKYDYDFSSMRSDNKRNIVEYVLKNILNFDDISLCSSAGHGLFYDSIKDKCLITGTVVYSDTLKQTTMKDMNKLINRETVKQPTANMDIIINYETTI